MGKAAKALGTAFADETAHFEGALGLRDTARKTVDDDCDPEKAARRKFSAIMSYPTLAKYLGLIGDVEVPLGDIAPTGALRTYGAVAVQVADRDGNLPVGADTQSGTWTTYVVARDPRHVPIYFGPPAEEETTKVPHGLSPDQLYRDGLLNLKATFEGKARYELVTLDVSNALINVAAQAETVVEASRYGQLSTSQSTRLPEPRTRGIGLYDRGRLKEEADAVSRVQTLARTTLWILDADDLVRGYRIDAALTHDGHWKKPEVWRPLVARNVEYGAEDVPPRFVADTAIRSVRGRDDGQVRPMKRLEEQTDGLLATANQEVFVWPGESLAVPAQRDPVNEGDGCKEDAPAEPLPGCDLAIDLTIDLPSENDKWRHPLPLRESMGYVFGSRLCFDNGCGLGFDDALSRYVAADPLLVLGSPGGGVYTFLPHEEVQAPDVLLPWDDRLVEARSPATDAPGETVDCLVVRSGGTKTATARRFVVPPRATFDTCEQAGVFDHDSGDRPRGAFVNRLKIHLDKDSGSFPVARGGTWEFGQPCAAVAPAGKESAKPVEPSRGSVLVLDDRADRPRHDFYPDPLAPALCVRFVEDPAQAAEFGSLHEPIEFWEGKDPKDAVPVVLELLAGRGNSDRRRGWFDPDDRRVRMRSVGGGSKEFKKLAVVLAPAEDVELELWPTVRSGETGTLLRKRRRLSAAVDLLRKKVGEKGPAIVESMALKTGQARKLLDFLMDATQNASKMQMAVERILCSAPMVQVTTRRRVRVVHAVDRPLAAPEFVWQHYPDEPAKNLRFYPIVLTVTSKSQQKQLKTWKEYVENQGSLDPRHWLSEEGGTTTFFVGTIMVNRPSTVDVRCEARWLEHGPDGVRQDDDGIWRFDPPANYARLFKIDEILPRNPGQLPGDPTAETSPLDLLKADDGKTLRSLSHGFANGKARKLSLRLIGTSRFTSFYPELTDNDKERAERTGVGKHERASPPFDDTRAIVWVPATFRPTPPELDLVLPLFRWTQSAMDDEREIRWSRACSYRILLKKDSWHSTGEGEMLALVCWPANLLWSEGHEVEEAEAAAGTERLTICDLEEPPKQRPFASYVTRWGADPIHKSGPMEDLIPADRFSGYAVKRENLRLYLEPQPATDSAEADAYLPVSIAAYEPRLDPREGLWYCDVTVDPGAAYFPFIQFGLARYQPHCVEQSFLELSHPVRAFGQLMPRREGRVVFSGERKIVIEVHGIGYHRSETGHSHEEQRHLTDVPLLNVRLLCAVEADDIPREKNGGIRWRRVLDKVGNPVEVLRLRPVQRGAEVWWVLPMTLPTNRWDTRYGLLLEEVELMAADRMSKKDGLWTDCSDIEFTTELEERGPMLIKIIDLRASD